jgi:ABC-type dipeptide/oligopeptide/nickel transport system ATPase subunit/GNAT superfamily N-acetyltransferase
VPAIDIVRESRVRVSARARQLASMFELTPECTSERWSFDFTLPEVWGIGVIVGPSGSGKSTVAAELFGGHIADEGNWPEDATIIDGFDGVPIKEVAEVLSSVGFSSPPAWFRPFHVLSTGQKFRANVARALAKTEGLFVIDEFTSVVDRTVAQIGSAAIGRAVRRAGRQFVAVTCHSDIIDWLQPDWVLIMPEGKMVRRSVQLRPSIPLDVYRTDHSAWDIFAQHHYLSHDLNKSAGCYVAVTQGRPVAFAAVLAFPHPHAPGWRGHRTVVLPDFQGVGIGNKLSELVAAAYASTGKPYTSTTTHPAMMKYRAKSNLWHMMRAPDRMKGSTKTANSMKAKASFGRYTASFRFVGAPNPAAATAFGLK